ncbi:GNAT family N-acetyltransferase [Pseudidiomarina homiensis]|uniref:GNAT family N-acetyltransferase n=1 Tax=Pseudidiomarina homiensis TaxID=364198 RepID=UPI002810F706|nr:GNAT family N-acyltransferase [Pseudidiomarina homiensis]
MRELTFRAIGEGTGQRRDLDRYDVQFSHLLLWDAHAMEIAGSYRLAPVARMTTQQSYESLYTASLFQFKPTMERYLVQGMELGRSFIQPQYRNRYSLDYLWQGIGAYVQKHPGVRYLFGPVSLSGEFPRAAQAMIVWFYQQWFPPLQEVATPNQPFIYTPQEEQWLAALFEHRDYAQDLQTLKAELQHLDVKLPPLFKQYSELCEPGGVQFACFSVDPAFNNSIDALLIVDLHQLKPRRKQRYLQNAMSQH